MLDKVKVILASASPRRTELLTQAGIAHEIIKSTCEEIITTNVPEELVMDLSAQKAEDVFLRYLSSGEKENFIVIGSDTVVAADGKILGKPKNDEDAYRMIKRLQDNQHQVYTGVTIYSNIEGTQKRNTFFECSHVNVYPMNEEEIQHYLSKNEHGDKAGAYGIQGAFAIYIKGIEGDYNNIVGLPIARLYQELKQL